MDYQLPTIDFTTAVALGLLAPNYVRAFGIGYNPDIDILGVPEDCWGGDGLFNWPVAATAMQVRSTDINDNAAGTGMRTLTISALDANYNAAPVTITLNGTTPVPLPASILRSNGLRGLTAGSVGVNVGQIILETAGGGTMYGTILPGIGVANQAPYTVPAGFTLVVPQLLLDINSPGGTANQFASMRTWFRFFGANPCIVQPLPIGTTNIEPYPHQSAPAFTAPEKTDFALRVVVVSDNNTVVTAAWNGFLRKN